MKTSSVASAPAKVILFGEHFVVHGSSAVLASIKKRISAKAVVTDEIGRIEIVSDLGRESITFSSTAGIDSSRAQQGALSPLLISAKKIMLEKHVRPEPGIRIHIESHVLPGIGLGSSAASCVATVAAVASLFGPVDRQWICSRAMEAEGLVHGNASGADCYVSTFGGLVSYNRNQSMGPINAKSGLTLVVCNTGVVHSTMQEVRKVSSFREQNSGEFENIQQELNKIVSDAGVALVIGDIARVGQLMSQNQRLLRRIGVSHPKAEQIIDAAIKSGALGAKVTGAGGGGAVIALAAGQPEGETIRAAVEKLGYESFTTGVDTRGLIVE